MFFIKKLELISRDLLRALQYLIYSFIHVLFIVSNISISLLFVHKINYIFIVNESFSPRKKLSFKIREFLIRYSIYNCKYSLIQLIVYLNNCMHN